MKNYLALALAAWCVAPVCGLFWPTAAGKDGQLLQNPGFEMGLTGWLPTVYGTQPTVETDTAVYHEGKQSLRIAAEAPSDAALHQEIKLHPCGCYRLTAWVCTYPSQDPPPRLYRLNTGTLSP
jgi:hypothetical protein